MLRIVFVTNEFVSENNFDGGLANYLYKIVTYLRKNNHYPIVFVPSVKSEILFFESIEIHRVNIDYGLLSKLILKFSFGYLNTSIRWINQSYKINKAIKELHKKDAISIIQYTSSAALGLFMPINIPSVIRISSYSPMCNYEYGYARTIDLKLTEKIENICLKRSYKLFAPSNFTARLIKESIKKEVDVIRTPFNKFDIEFDESVYLNVLHEKKYILFFGTLCMLKGVGVIADILQKLLEQHPWLFFVFVGKDIGYKDQSMKSIVLERSKKVNDRIIFIKKLKHTQLFPIIKNAYLTVLPSLVDNFPNTLIEAMSLKQIVVGTIGTSFEEIIHDGINGFLCEKGNSHDLLNTIYKVLNLSEITKNEIKDHAYQSLGELNPDKTVNQLINYYYFAMNHN